MITTHTCLFCGNIRITQHCYYCESLEEFKKGNLNSDNMPDYNASNSDMPIGAFLVLLLILGPMVYMLFKLYYIIFSNFVN
jgi:hypothetical protein